MHPADRGCACRSAELFDWLRALPEGHELAKLCDVYTYTTVISQCGSHQQLRKALELIAEMRGRGVQCNVHTFSALMNVCIKVRCTQAVVLGRALHPDEAWPACGYLGGSTVL